MSADRSPETILNRFEQSLQQTISIEKRVSKSLNIWLLQPIDEKTETIALLQWLRHQPEVLSAQYNHILNNRNTPNDPLFNQQWQLLNTGQSGGLAGADLGALPAWDITTGGLSAAGDTIVVAVIDGGIAAGHPDIAANLWFNRAEIPNDQIDNDNNGFVDDYRGWNVWTQDDQIEGNATSHGTPVSGIIGAKGDNSIGVAGVNWHIKIMFVAGGNDEAAILEAYDYIVQARQRYNSSQGQEGAFVVAVNCSWGADYGAPQDAPLWCAAFDALGQDGILGVASTANIPVDVDVVGDLPTSCPSDYLLAVTSLNKNNEKAANAAWGAQHIDLGAFGQEVYTTATGNSYGSFSGTSFAAPQVSGAIGLLYSAPCPNLISLAKSNPAAAALWVKNLVLESAVPNNSLAGITAGGGALHLGQLLQHYQDQCSACPAPFALKTTVPGVDSVWLSWVGIDDYQTVQLRWRIPGTPEWTLVENVQSPYLLENCLPCTSYEFSVAAFCSSAGSWSDWSEPFVFETDGCCKTPVGIQTSAIGATSCVLQWQPVTAANAYELRFREMGAADWQEWQTESSTYSMEGLLPCSVYEWQLRTICDTGSTTFSDVFSFQTAGCGSCLDAEYCFAEAGQSNYEWIQAISAGDWSHFSGAAGAGYQNFTGELESVLKIAPESSIPVVITPAFATLPFKEFFRIYIDYNMDGDFTDSGELAFDPGYAHDGPMQGFISAPAFNSQGLTRMRVLMKYKNLNNTMPGPCESFDYGQIEDYCVELLDVPVPYSLTTRQAMQLSIYPQPAEDYVRLVFPEDMEGDWHWSVCDANGRTILKGSSELERFNDIKIYTKNWLPGLYVVTAQQEKYTFKGKILKM